MSGAWVLLALVGCPSARKQGPVAPTQLEPVSSQPIRTPVAGPERWTEPGGLCLGVPAGWTGTAGPAPELLELSHESGVELAVRTWSTLYPTPAVPPGFELFFDDDDTYRAVPALRGGGTWTWVSLDPQGPLIQGWYASEADRVVAVQVTYPFGKVTVGRSTVDPLLGGLTRCL